MVSLPNWAVLVHSPKQKKNLAYKTSLSYWSQNPPIREEFIYTSQSKTVVLKQREFAFVFKTNRMWILFFGGFQKYMENIGIIFFFIF